MIQCPKCSREIETDDWDGTSVKSNPDGRPAVSVSVSWGTCPGCKEPIVIVDEGCCDSNSPAASSLRTIFPTPAPRPVAQEVPPIYRSEFIEAAGTLEASPKASAALSRRLLQQFFEKEYRLYHDRLDRQIEIFVQQMRNQFPASTLDMLQSLNKFAPSGWHPLYTTTPELIVEIIHAEAEWLLDTLEALFDGWFVEPEREAKRQKDLQQRLKNLGKYR